MCEHTSELQSVHNEGSTKIIPELWPNKTIETCSPQKKNFDFIVVTRHNVISSENLKAFGCFIHVHKQDRENLQDD